MDIEEEGQRTLADALEEEEEQSQDNILARQCLRSIRQKMLTKLTRSKTQMPTLMMYSSCHILYMHLVYAKVVMRLLY